MLLTGTLLIIIGISGIIITMIYIIKLFDKPNKNKLEFLMNDTDGAYDVVQKDQIIIDNNIEALRENFKREGVESTVLLNDSIIDEVINETVLLEEDKL